MRFAVPPADGPPLAERAAARSTARLVAARAHEAELLMTAGAAVMLRCGTTRRAPVAEIVRESGLSNQAFYRHFAGKDDLVAAIVDEGARRLRDYLSHLMAKESDPAEAIRAWIRGVLRQACDPDVAEATRAINWNRSVLAGEADVAARQAESMIWHLLIEPLEQAGSVDAECDGYLVSKLTFGVLIETLWLEAPPTEDEMEYVVEFCMAGIAARLPHRSGRRRPKARSQERG